MITITDIHVIVGVAETAILKANEHENCSDMLKKATQFIENPTPKRAVIFLGALLALDGEKNLPTQAEGQILFLKFMSHQLR